MVGHQDVGMDRTIMLPGIFGKDGEVELAIEVVAAADPSIHAPLDDLLRDAGHVESVTPRHP
jgi:hypothetical protein